MCSIGAVGGTVQNLKLFLSLDLGLAQMSVAQVLSLVLFSSLIGRVLMGVLADRWPRKRVMLLIYAIVAASIPLLFIADRPWARPLFAVLFGIGLGGDYMIIPLMAADLFGVATLGRLLGIVLTADGVGEAVAPMLVARIRDASGSYAGGFSVLIALAAIGALAVALLPSPVTAIESCPRVTPARLNRAFEAGLKACATVRAVLLSSSHVAQTFRSALPDRSTG